MISVFKRRRRWLIAAGLVAVLVVIWLLLVAKSYTNHIDSYRVVDERTIVLQVTSGGGVWTRVTNVTETASDVRITVQSLDWLPGPRTALGIPVELTVRLAQPVGHRVVMDGEGNLAPQPKCTDNVCSPLPSP